MPVLIFPLPDPIAAKWLVTFLIGLDLALALIGATDGIAHIAHLGGAATALLYLKGQDWWRRAASGVDGTRRSRACWLSQPPESAAAGRSLPRRSAPSRGRLRPARQRRDRSRARQDHRERRRQSDAGGAQVLTEISRRLRTPPKA